ncbi:hypothetical protein CR513_35624, partial [Mucuna pruriens]
MNLRQEEDESLHYFMERFSVVAVRITDLNPEVTLHSMIMALKLELFSNSFYKKPPTLIDKLRARAFGVPHAPIDKKGKERDTQGLMYQIFTPLTTNRAALL